MQDIKCSVVYLGVSPGVSEGCDTTTTTSRCLTYSRDSGERQGDRTAGQRPCCCRRRCGPTLTGIHSAQHPAVSTSAPFLTRLWRKSFLMAQMQDTIPRRADLFAWLKATLTERREDRFLFLLVPHFFAVLGNRGLQRRWLKGIFCSFCETEESNFGRKQSEALSRSVCWSVCFKKNTHHWLTWLCFLAYMLVPPQNITPHTAYSSLSAADWFS